MKGLWNENCEWKHKVKIISWEKDDGMISGYTECTTLQSCQNLFKESLKQTNKKLSMPQFPNLQYWDNYKTYLIEQLRESNEIIPKKNMVGFESQKDWQMGKFPCWRPSWCPARPFAPLPSTFLPSDTQDVPRTPPQGLWQTKSTWYVQENNCRVESQVSK